MQWPIQGRGLGGLPPPPYFQTKLRPEGPKEISLETGPPLFLKVWMTTPPSYLKVWVLHCFVLSLPYPRVKSQLYSINSSRMFLDKITFLEILLNPVLN